MTEIIKLDKDDIDRDKLLYAAEVLKKGGLVAFPTETVYGLGADALNENAVRGIFAAKGRPSDNPLIVHIADKDKLGGLVRRVPSSAQKAVDEFWPGPLTIILPKSGIVPSVVTAGLDTVAVRMPAHPVALELIRLAGICVAAPSANLSGRPSPTRAEHVIEDLWGRVDVIIDAGSAEVGLESTVLDMMVEPPMILRPGGVTPAQLREIIGEIAVDPAVENRREERSIPKSPGMKYTHYSPRADVLVVEGNAAAVAAKVRELAAVFSAAGKKVGIMATDQTLNLYPSGFAAISAGDREKPDTIASNLFNTLRKFDEMGVDVILAEAVESTGIGLAVMNRLRKAAGYNTVRADD
ncbi:MAG: threonylcarbamoyl-AMP synthase [Firmicutes bacterium]|nr:threonylcarbamoyl-AMP synthase [Bacillota bacterium]